MASSTSPSIRTVFDPSLDWCFQGEPGFQSDTFSWPQYWRVISGSVRALKTFSGVARM